MDRDLHIASGAGIFFNVYGSFRQNLNGNCNRNGSGAVLMSMHLQAQFRL